MALQQTLVGDSKERKPIEIIFIIDFHAFGKTGGRVTRGDQADQYAIHIDLIAIWRSSTADSPAIGKAGVDGGIQRDDVARKAVGNGDRPAQIYGVDDVEARPFEFGNRAVRNPQCLIDPQSFHVADQYREQNIRAEVGHVFKRSRVKIQGLTLCPNQAGIKKRQRIATNLHPVAGPFKASDDIAGVDRLHLLAADARPHTEQAVGGARLELAVVGDAVREDVLHGNFEGDREHIEPETGVTRVGIFICGCLHLVTLTPAPPPDTLGAMAEYEIRTRRWTRLEYEKLIQLGIFGSMFVGFGLSSVLFWSYFRFRRPRAAL